VVIIEQEEARREGERERPGLTIFTDGSKTLSGAAGYAVVWKNKSKWVGIKTHMRYDQKAFDTEFAALARSLNVAVRRRSPPERVTILTDAQAAMGRMVAEEPGPWQKYAIMARRRIAALRAAKPKVPIEIRCFPATREWRH